MMRRAVIAGTISWTLWVALMPAGARKRPIRTAVAWTSLGVTSRVAPALAATDLELEGLGVSKQNVYVVYPVYLADPSTPTKVFYSRNFGAPADVAKDAPAVFSQTIRPVLVGTNQDAAHLLAVTTGGDLLYNRILGGIWGDWQLAQAGCTSPVAVSSAGELHVVARCGYWTYLKRDAQGQWQVIQSLKTIIAGQSSTSYPQLVTKGSTIFLVFRQYVGGAIRIAVKPSGSAFFGSPSEVGGSTSGAVSVVYHDRSLHVARRSGSDLYYIRSVDDPELLSNPFGGSTWSQVAAGTAFSGDPALFSFRHVLLATATDSAAMLRYYYKDPNTTSAAPSWLGGWTVPTLATLLPVSVGAAERVSMEEGPPTTYNPQEVYAAAVDTNGTVGYINLFRALSLQVAKTPNNRIRFDNGPWNQAICPECAQGNACTLDGQRFRSCVPGFNDCPAGYDCVLVRGTSRVCKKSCASSSECFPGEACQPLVDYVRCGPSSPAPEQDFPSLNEIGLALMSWPASLLDAWKTAGNPGVQTAEYADCLYAGSSGSASTIERGPVYLSPEATPMTAFHEWAHRIERDNVLPVAPWNYAVNLSFPFRVGSGGYLMSCQPECAVSPCGECKAPLVCQTAKCRGRACNDASACTVGPNFNWPGDPCEHSSLAMVKYCNGRRPYGFITDYSSIVPCSGADTLCENFAEVSSIWRFAGHVFRQRADYDRFAVQLAYQTRRLCRQANYVRGLFADAQFDGYGTLHTLTPYEGETAGVPSRSMSWICPD
jgi:hypothetical protein